MTCPQLALTGSEVLLSVRHSCQACGGAGQTIRYKCPDCKGRGRVVEETTLSIKIPAGVDDGARVRLVGEGEPGVKGGPRGDLFVFVRVKPHPFFVRQGNALLCEVPITYPQAALGGTIEVPTLNGKETLDVPAGTQSGDLFRIRGKGIPNVRGRGKGDQIVRVFVEVPEILNERQEELLRELAELAEVNVSPKRKSFYEKLKEYFED